MTRCSIAPGAADSVLVASKASLPSPQLQWQSFRQGIGWRWRRNSMGGRGVTQPSNGRVPCGHQDCRRHAHRRRQRRRGVPEPLGRRGARRVRQAGFAEPRCAPLQPILLHHESAQCASRRCVKLRAPALAALRTASSAHGGRPLHQRHGGRRDGETPRPAPPPHQQAGADDETGAQRAQRRTSWAMDGRMATGDDGAAAAPRRDRAHGRGKTWR